MAFSRPYPAPPQGYGASPSLRAQAPPQPPPPSAIPPVQVPPGTLPPGTIVNVGECQVIVERFLSEGGFAHVYLANSAVPLPVGSPTATTKHVLKRMAVPDKRGVAEVGKEVEVMRQLKNHPKIVNMIEASVADLPGGVDGSRGYEIYILMEWCQGGGIIDMMNTRLQNRMTESEILKIFADTVEAVAHMHYQSPPLIHRDLKVENILLTPPQTYKLCDFGSTCQPLPREKVPTAVEGIQKIEMEINKTTTLQYRAPELVDVWGRKGFDEKIDIWALGVFLYKLCYYTTPFEENGPLAILNAQYKFPPFPAYSPQIRSLIASMLQEKPENRPNIYQVHELTCRLRSVPVRLENKYARSAASTNAGRQGALSPPFVHPNLSRPSSAQPPVPNILSSNPQASSSAPNLNQLPGLQGLASQVAPMRRGRPGKLPGTPGGSKDGFSGFESPSSSSAGGSKGPATTNGTDGFGDTFSPSSNSIQTAKSPEVPLATEVEMPQNMEMFRDLASPESTKASSAQDGGGKTKEEEDEERKRFESTFPALLDDDLAPFGLPSSTSSHAATQPQNPVPSLPTVTSPKPIGMQLTGEQPGPPLPRRPPTASPAPPSSTSEPKPSTLEGVPSTSNRPLLVERGSQTSPHLLASWKNGSTSTTPTQPPTINPSTTESNGRSGLRQSSIPEFDLSSPAGNPPPPTLDLLDDDEGRQEDFDILKPQPHQQTPLPASPAPPVSPSFQPQSSPSIPPNTASSSADITTGTVANKRMSFLSPNNSPTTTAIGGSEGREKFRPVRKSMAGFGFGTGKNHEVEVSQQGKEEEEKKEKVREKEEDKVEERFPALPDEVNSGREEPLRRGTEFEDVVEREETGDDTSDEEQATGSTTPRPQAVTTTKVSKPSFSDDDDFAPKPIVPKPSSGPNRPRFGPRPPSSTSQTSLSSTTNRLSLASSPASSFDSSRRQDSNETGISRSESSNGPSRSSTVSSVASSDGGGGDIDLGPALASIRKFAPSGNNNNHVVSKLEKQVEMEEDDDFPPSSTSTILPPIASTTTLPPITSTTPALVATSPAPSGGGFVPSRPSSTQPPPILSPKPRQGTTGGSSSGGGGIDSIVSRYEGMGTRLTGGPPPIGTKPVGLRKDSTGSNASLGRDSVNPRPLPPHRGTSNSSLQSFTSSTSNVVKVQSESTQEGNEGDSQGREKLQNGSKSPGIPPPQPSPKPRSSFAASSYTSNSSNPSSSSSSSYNRVPFKPVPPPSSPQTSRSRYSIAGPSSSSSTTTPTNNESVQEKEGPLAQAEEEEEKFAGVRNMKSRWESMSSRDSSKASGQDKRKSWAAV